jgi:hypothetical protein
LFDLSTGLIFLIFRTSEIDRNEEFFSSVETEWQMESGNFEPWTKLDHTELEPKLVSDLPEMSRKSFILIDDQAKQINSLLPPRCIGAQFWVTYLHTFKKYFQT